jgi:hypothetical protein
MVDKRDLMKETEKSFGSLKKELGLKVEFKELDGEFHVVDSVFETGYVLNEFSIQLTSRIVDYFRNWSGYLNGLLMPNASYYASQTESKLFNAEEERQKVWKIIKTCMDFSSMYSLMHLKNDREMIGKFIDEAYQAWVSEVRPFMIEVLGKVNKAWSK